MKRETETLDKLYLEWSQFTTAKTSKELAMEAENARLREAAQAVVDIEFDDILDEGHGEAVRKLRCELLGGGEK